MKKTVSIVIMLIMVFTLVGCSTSTDVQEESEETYVLNLAYATSDTQSTHLAAVEFKEKVEERTEGRVKIELYPSGALYSSEFDAIEAVQLGNLEMTITATTPLAGFVEEFMVIDLPYVFSDFESAYEALDGELGNKLLEKLPEIGLKGLTYGETGFRQMVNNRGPIESPEDLKGLKIRTMESPAHLKPFQKWGANPSPLAFGELYTALQQGTFDAMEAPISLIYSSRFHEVQDYITISNHFYTATLMFINNDLFESMPQDIQDIIQETAYEFSDSQRNIAAQQESEWFQTIQEEGVKINELSKEQKAVFQQLGLEVYEELESQIGKELIDLAKEISNK